jgi:hypothetical protein
LKFHNLLLFIMFWTFLTLCFFSFLLSLWVLPPFLALFLFLFLFRFVFLFLLGMVGIGSLFFLF